jgi:hypothetical protein
VIFAYGSGKDCGLCGKPMPPGPALFHPATCDKVVHAECHATLRREARERQAAEAAAMDLLDACRMAAVSAGFARLPAQVRAAMLAAVEKATPGPEPAEPEDSL